MDKVERCYNFFFEKEESNSPFTLADVVDATGWKRSTVQTYPAKKWETVVRKVGRGTYTVTGIRTMSLVEFRRMHSQKNTHSSDPRKPVLLTNVEALVLKARESALLALDIYNRPATLFRTQGFTVMMVIAGTALLHAVFERDRKDYAHKGKNGEPIIVDGDPKCWELAKCASVYYRGKEVFAEKNLEFIIRLRNKIEHRFVPAIDPHVAGECQLSIPL